MASGKKSVTRTATALRFEVEDGTRLAVVLCPLCSEEHWHVVPTDTVHGARPQRIPRCTGRHGDYMVDLDAISSPTKDEALATAGTNHNASGGIS